MHGFSEPFELSSFSISLQIQARFCHLHTILSSPIEPCPTVLATCVKIKAQLKRVRTWKLGSLASNSISPIHTRERRKKRRKYIKKGNNNLTPSSYSHLVEQPISPHRGRKKKGGGNTWRNGNNNLIPSSSSSPGRVFGWIWSSPPVQIFVTPWTMARVLRRPLQRHR